MTTRPWMPPSEIEGPASIYGYDGNVHPERATPSDWRGFWMRRARQLGTHTKAEWQSKVDAIGCCLGCGSADVVLTKDHIVPVSKGGCDCIHNLQPLCTPCNSRKGDRI